jgi:hypothetical protein
MEIAVAMEKKDCDSRFIEFGSAVSVFLAFILRYSAASIGSHDLRQFWSSSCDWPIMDMLAPV